MPVGPVFQGVARAFRQGGVGPTFQGTAAEIRDSGVGPVFQGVAAELRVAGVGPVFQGEANQIKEQAVGPVFQGVANEARASGVGPVFQGEANQARSEGVGPVFQGTAEDVPLDPGGPSLPAGPVVPVVPPAPPPDISGVSPIITDPDLTPPQRRALLAKDNDLRNLRSDDRVVSQRYTGPAYPFGPSVNGTLGPKDDFSVVVTSMINILTTPRGSIPYNPRMGSDIPLLVFEILDEITLNLIRYFTFKDLSEQEPRVAVRQVFAQVDPVDPNRVLVDVGFSLVGDPEGSIYGIPVLFSQDTVGGI